MKPTQCSALVLMLYEFLQYASGDQFVNSLNGVIGAENYTYYRLTHRGYIRLILESTQGDADLYISSSTQSPTFDQYEFQATTCGDDIVDVQPSMNRPVTVGVYGYPSVTETKYILHLILITDYDRGYPEELASSDFVPPSQKKSTNKHNQKSFGASAKDEEESVIWTIIVGILKILFDVLM